MSQELPLGVVLDQLRAMLGPTSWIANGFLTKVECTEEIETFAMSGDGRLLYNPKFKKKWITDERRLKEILLHEILHKVYNDFIRENDHWTNLGADVVINFTVRQMLGHCDLMNDFYKDDKSQEAFLCPDFTSPNQTPLSNLWRLLQGYNSVESEASNQDVIDALKGHFEEAKDAKSKKKPKLLGGHGEGKGEGERPDNQEEGEQPGKPVDISNEDMNRIAEDVQNAAANGGQIAGVGGVLGGMLTKAIETSLTIKSRVFKNFAQDNNMGKIKSYFTTTRRVSSVFPINPSRSNLLMVAAGQCPTIWRNEVRSESHQNKGLSVYIDVSGSMYQELPKICGLLRNMGSYLSEVYQFSNDVYKSTLKELAEGKIKSTGGTDFNCIIDSAANHGERKIVIITDGCADADQKRREMAKANIDKVMVILTGGWNNEDNWFSKTYKSQTYKLDELVK